MNRRVISVMFIICMVLSLTACNSKKNKTDDTELTQPAFKSYEVKDKIIETDENETIFTVLATDKEKLYKLKISGDLVKQELSITADTSAFLAQKAIALVDLNYDGYKDLVVTKVADASESVNSNKSNVPKLNVYLYSIADDEYVKTDAEICNYELSEEYKGTGVFVSHETDYGTTGTDSVYKFDGVKLTLLRSASFELNDDKKLFVRVMDYTNGGSFLMYKQTFTGDGKNALKHFNTDLYLLTGLDGQTITEKTAEEAVHKVAGKASSGVVVDCEGFINIKNNLCYLMRVDKSTTTSAYYYVDTVSGEVKLKQGSSELI